MRDPETEIHDVGSLEIRVDGHEVARAPSTSGGATRYRRIRRKNRPRAIPKNLIVRKFLSLHHDIAAEGLAAYWNGIHATRPIIDEGTRRVGTEGDCRGVLELVLVHPLDGCKSLVDDTEPSPDDGRALAVEIPGKTHSWRKVAAIGLPQGSKAWLTLLNESRR